MTRNSDIQYTLNSKSKSFSKGFKNNWQLHLMIILPLAYIIIFYYLPMYGIQIAFRDFRVRDGIMGSEWVGLKHFKEFFEYYKWKNVVWNTLSVSLYSIVAGFPIPIILALVIHTSNNKWLKKFTQNLSYIPHFISMVVLVGIINQIFNPISGVLGAIQEIFDVNIYGDIRSSSTAFRHLYVWSGIWQNMGWSSIIYVAALGAVSPELHEAAKIDGASRFKRIIHVDIPAIMPTICIMLILRCSSIMSVGFEKVFLMQNSLNLSTAEVISTYVYKSGIGENQLSYGTAVGLMNSVINTFMVILVNYITNKMSDKEAGLF